MAETVHCGRCNADSGVAKPENVGVYIPSDLGWALDSEYTDGLGGELPDLMDNVGRPQRWFAICQRCLVLRKMGGHGFIAIPMSGGECDHGDHDEET
jgi:hypothetical protein